MKTYAIYFAQEHVEFRYNEIRSLLQLWDIPCVLPESAADPAETQKPFYIVELPNEDAARELASRSVSIRCILELWSHAAHLNAFHDSLKGYLKLHENDTEFRSFFAKDKSFKITVETFNRHLKQSEKIEKIESLTYLPVQGAVNLKQPVVEWYYIEYYGHDTVNVPEYPLDIVFGRWITDGNRSMIKDISLKTRKFIGNTSMDAQLSLLMANQVMAKRGDFIFDPFVGSGSLLVAAAKFEAFVAGTDIDFLMLHGRTRPTRVKQKVRAEDESVHANLKQYKLEKFYLDVLVSDFSLPIWTNDIFFDGIITDPPYGIRETHEKIQFKDRSSSKSDEPMDNLPHYPSKSLYDLPNLYGDLLQFAAKYLRMGARLVCWIPIIREDYCEESIPKHNCLRLLANSEQLLTSLTSRRLLTYEKIAEPKHSFTEELRDIDESADFRKRYSFFTHRGESRQERRIQRAELRKIGHQEALKRGKFLNENGKVIDPSKSVANNE